MRRQSRGQASTRSDHSQDGRCDDNEVENAINTKRFLQAHTDERAQNRADTTQQDQLPAQGHDPIRWHDIMSMSDANRVKRGYKASEQSHYRQNHGKRAWKMHQCERRAREPYAQSS